MRIAATIGLFTALLAFGGCTKGTDACTGATPRAPRPPVPTADYKIELTGPAVPTPVTLTYAQLRELPMVTLHDITMQQTYAPDSQGSWRGPTFDRVLAAANLKPGDQEVTLVAIDGYTLTCERSQLAGAIIALQDGDSRWLADVDPAAPVRLVPPRLPGNYWIQNIVRIHIK